MISYYQQVLCVFIFIIHFSSITFSYFQLVLFEETIVLDINLCSSLAQKK